MVITAIVSASGHGGSRGGNRNSNAAHMKGLGWLRQIDPAIIPRCPRLQQEVMLANGATLYNPRPPALHHLQADPLALTPEPPTLSRPRSVSPAIGPPNPKTAPTNHLRFPVQW
jgi:hypothetical protein